MSDKNWKLGDDLYTDNNILDPITFEDILLMLQCNEKIINTTSARKCFKELLEMRLEDARFLFDNNIDEIVKIAKSRRNE